MTPPGADLPEFTDWLDDFLDRVRATDLPTGAAERYLAQAEPDSTVLQRSLAQPEFQLSPGAYIERTLTPMRIAHGKAAKSQYEAALKTAEARLGADASVLAAIWGLETDYGRSMGDFPTLTALSTLAAAGRRAEFWESELTAALRIAASGAVEPDRLRGSWAGAMGHTQFMPSSYLSDALTLTGCGRSDIWSDDPSDALASTANFLTRRGWRAGRPWGCAAELPSDFDFTLSGRWNSAPPSRWRTAGVRPLDGRDFADWGHCSLILPAGHPGPAFLVTGNFTALLRYNASESYALAAGLLADALNGCGRLPTGWPDPAPLLRGEIKELQTLLTRRGHDTGGIDGIAGPATLRSIQAQQAKMGDIPDGFPARHLLDRLRA